MKKTRITRKDFKQKQNQSDVVAVMHAAGTRVLPIIKMLFGKKKLKFLLDTGAEYNILDDRIFEYLKDEVEYQRVDCSSIGINGGKVSGYFQTKMDLSIGGRTYATPLRVMRIGCFPDDVWLPSIPFYGILSCEFLIQNNWILDFSKGVVRVNFKGKKNG